MPSLAMSKRSSSTMVMMLFIHMGKESIAESGEAASADKEAVSYYPEKFKAMIDEGGYTSQTIFNVDETGLFQKKMPKRMFIMHEERTFPGFKVAKDRLTVMVGTNAASDCKLKPLLVYCMENQRALKKNLKLACL
ncbi:tigger transposable element-derived protein 1-like [Centruroides sculpturatus]|uniref:tigger transposable element-derived protein 1-like n=1 Tax=Centruroides sculpturatus TaxID=218467 RepID=UPI000C6E02DB|nr:tigger transposable element-derived protein 1-like [Centruroides sculpturatus]